MSLHMAKKYKPFSTRDFFSEWSSRNCGTCKKGWEERRLIFRCEWQRALNVAMVDDGQITEEVARAIGLLDNKGCTIWECPGWKRGRK